MRRILSFAVLAALYFPGCTTSKNAVPVSYTHLALLENTCSVITCDSKSMPVGLMLPLYGNTTQNERFRERCV